MLLRRTTDRKQFVLEISVDAFSVFHVRCVPRFDQALPLERAHVLGDGIPRHVQRFPDLPVARMTGICFAIFTVHEIGVHRDLGSAQIEREDLVRKRKIKAKLLI